MEDDEQRTMRLEDNAKGTRARREAESDEQRERRLAEDAERAQIRRQMEDDEQRTMRLEDMLKELEQEGKRRVTSEEKDD
ncbi:unnamed protein product [Haemonchus placei]|uniref:MFAP1 domain-containing protein n=1 Tax=Haemonchus placei TaxID=6290 RepID=A0A0N4WN55_HAEPC|nr:unnamed protein product [Haemonchus placei]